MATYGVHVPPGGAEEFARYFSSKCGILSGFGRGLAAPYRDPQDTSFYEFKIKPRKNSPEGIKYLLEHLNDLKNRGLITNYYDNSKKRKRS